MFGRVNFVKTHTILYYFIHIFIRRSSRFRIDRNNRCIFHKNQKIVLFLVISSAAVPIMNAIDFFFFFL